jgi:hypothetical protein
MLGMRKQSRGPDGRWIEIRRGKFAREHRAKGDQPNLPLPQSVDMPIPDEVMAETADTRDESDEVQSDGDSAGDGVKNRPDYQLLVDRMDQVEKALLQVPSLMTDPASIEEQLTLLRELLVELDRLRASVDLLEAGGSGQGPSAAVAVAAHVEAIRADAETAHNRWKAGWTRVWEAVKRMLPQLWVLISGLLHVKEWTVSGQLKSDSFGLASASVTVTFARPD